MLRTLLVGLWVCIVTLGATFGGVYWRGRQSSSGTAEHAEKLEVRKAKAITAPVIADGVVKGYVSAEFSYVMVPADKHGGGGELDPESFFLDEAFRLIYAETKADFTRVEKSDLAALTRQITENVNQRLGKPVVKETLVRNFTFVSRDDMPK